MLTEKGKIEITLDTDAVQQWDYLHTDDMQGSIAQLLIELGEGLRDGIAPDFLFHKVNGYHVQLEGHHMGTIKFTPAGIELDE